MKIKVDINDICDYIILSLKSNNIELNLLKLQKLIYYVERVMIVVMIIIQE